MLILFGGLFSGKYIFNKFTLIFLILLILISSVAFFGTYYFTSYNSGEEEKTTKSPSTPRTSAPSTSTYRKPSSVPLTADQKKLVEDTILSSEFVSDIPKKYPISLQFFYFQDGKRIWQDKYYMADGEILGSATPTIKLTLHSKYLDDLESGGDLCNLIKTANKNKDLGFESDSSETSLLWKYKGMVKHRKCMGF